MVNGKIITQELKDFIESEQYDIKFPRNYQILREINVLNGVIDLLFRRKWTLALAPTDLFFITCDRPVHLISSTPDNQIHFSGFGLKNRQVIFPLSKKTVLIGNLDGKDESITARTEMVAGINSNLLMAASSQVFLQASTNQNYLKKS